MNKSNPILYYGRSTLNIVLSLFTISLIIGSTLLFKGILKVIVPVGIFILYITATVIILFSKQGAKEILSEQEEDRVKKVNRVITRYREMRDRIAFLRIGDDEMRKAVEYFLLVSGNYFNKCRELLSYSPEANRKIEQVLEICQIYLEEYDDRLTEKRYGVKDKDHFDAYQQRTIKAIQDAADSIKKKMANDLSDLTREEKLEIIEEMNSDR
ncbi:MAG: hypothetical protein JXB88_27310 [Spirochaetales bacterium]|nr:hypothetical protein [Spirochaetales bacterium]